MLIVTGTIAVPSANLSAFHIDLLALASSARRRTGNLSYDVAVIEAAAGQLLVTERWDAQSALDEHLASLETAGFFERWQGRMEGLVRKYDAGNERGVTDR